MLINDTIKGVINDRMLRALKNCTATTLGKGK